MNEEQYYPYESDMTADESLIVLIISILILLAVAVHKSISNSKKTFNIKTIIYATIPFVAIITFGTIVVASAIATLYFRNTIITLPWYLSILVFAITPLTIIFRKKILDTIEKLIHDILIETPEIMPYFFLAAILTSGVKLWPFLFVS